MSDRVSFKAWFHEMTGHDGCYPWQERLFARLCDGDIPSTLDLPTGLGKTSVMVIWLLARCLNPELPRRLVYVVDRRAVVDQATEEAEKIARKLSCNATGALSEIRSALGLAPKGELAVSTLRGRRADNRAWLSDPTVPAIIVGTVDMIGSRMLFSAYRGSRRMKPMLAGLIGCDSLIVLDESHLVQPFEHLLKAIGDETMRDGVSPAHPVPAFKMMTLTATAASGALGTTFELIDKDFAHERIKQLLHAPKPLHLADMASDKDALRAALADAAWARRMAEDGAAQRVLIYCDKRSDAEKVTDLLAKRIKAEAKEAKERVQLLTGARRVWEREKLKQDPVYRWFLGDGSAPTDQPAFLVATSAGEVGIDLDADAMVCDLVAWERMVQRLGRVNRRGRTVPAPVTVVPAGPEGLKANANKAAKEARDARLQKLECYNKALELLPGADKTFDASVRAITALKADRSAADILKAASTPAPLRPALTRPLVDAWAMTSLNEHPGRPDDISPWLHGWIDDDEPTIELVWRRWLPWRGRERGKEKEPDEKEVTRFFEAAPVHMTEILEVPKSAIDSKKLEKIGERLRDLDKDARPSWRRGLLLFDKHGTLKDYADGDKLVEDDRRKNFADRIAPGDRLVLHADCGCSTEGGAFDPTVEDAPVTADGDDAWAKQTGRRVTCGNDKPNEGWRVVWRLKYTVDEAGEEDEGANDLAIEKSTSIEALDDPAQHINRTSQTLNEHLSWTEQEADRLASRLAFSEPLKQAFATAGWLHDVGKHRSNWQASISEGSVNEPLAKSPGAGSPSALSIGGETYRHEFGSLMDALYPSTPADRVERKLAAEARRRLSALPEEWRDLVLHLVASHHGHARPVIAPVDQDHEPERCRTEARAIARRFAQLHAAWGPWGLAWLESVFRCADGAASRRLDEEGSGHG